MSKSFVSMETKMCIVTGKEFDSGAILMDRRIRDKFDGKTLTGWGISPEVQEKIDEGFIALIGTDESKSKVTGNRIMPEDAHRTGEIVYVKKEVLFQATALNVELFAFVDRGVVSYFKELQKSAV